MAGFQGAWGRPVGGPQKQGCGPSAPCLPHVGGGASSFGGPHSAPRVTSPRALKSENLRGDLSQSLCTPTLPRSLSPLHLDSAQVPVTPQTPPRSLSPPNLDSDIPGLPPSSLPHLLLPEPHLQPQAPFSRPLILTLIALQRVGMGGLSCLSYWKLPKDRDLVSPKPELLLASALDSLWPSSPLGWPPHTPLSPRPRSRSSGCLGELIAPGRLDWGDQQRRLVSIRPGKGCG